MQFNRLRISQKIMLLILWPILCEIIFVGVLVHFQSELETAAQRESNSREIVATANSILLEVNKLVADQAVLDFLGDQMNTERFSGIQEQIAREQLLMNYCPEQRQNAKLLSLHAQEAQAAVKILEANFLRGDRDLTAQSRRDLRIIVGKVFRDLNKIKEEEEKRHRDSRFESELSARRKLKLMMAVGVLVNVILTAILVGVFYKDVGGKLSTILDNIRLAGRDEPMHKTLDSSDELGDLDKTLHEMHSLIESSRRKERALLENATALICALDADLRFVAASPAADELLRVANSVIKGDSLRNLVKDEKQLEAFSALSRASQSSSSQSEVELELVRPDGSAVHTHWSIYWSAEDTEYFCVVTDISTRRQLEQMKRDFVNMISHDLRSPLTSLLLFLDILDSGAFGELNETAVIGLQQSKTSLNNLIAMVGDLLDIEKIEAGNLKLSLKNVELETVVTEAIDGLGFLMETHGIACNIEIQPVRVIADRRRLLQIVQNLVSNAIKFSHDGGKIDITARVADSHAIVSITDYGCGIDNEVLPALFDRFSRAAVEVAKKGIKGTGLGLSLCKALVELHKGQIGVKSRLGEGSEFWFSLPLCTDRDSETAAVPHDRQTTDTSTKKVSIN